MTDSGARRGGHPASRPAFSSLLRSFGPAAVLAAALALGAAGLVSRSSRSGATQVASPDDFYALRAIPRFGIHLAPAARAQLATAPREWVEADFTYQDRTWHRVGLRLKGHRALRGLDKKPSFKIKFGHFVKGQRFLGLRTLTLNAMVEDPTMMRETLGYRLYRAMGVPAPDTGYAQLAIDGAPYGVYVMVETVDKDFFDRRFGRHDGHLYEGEYGCDIYPADVAGMDIDLGGDDRAPLAALARAGAGPVADLIGGPHALFDRSALDYLAVSTVIGDFDGYKHGHNYRIYRRPGTGRWVFIPWGIDRTFDKHLRPFDSGGLVAKRCFADPDCRVAYLREVRRTLDTLARLDLDRGATTLTALLADPVAADPRHPYHLHDMNKARAGLHRFLRRRAEDLAPALACLGPDGAGTVDRDGDGYACMDCDDADPAMHPGAEEVCGDGRDQDCSGLADDSTTCDCPTRVIDGVTFALCDLPVTWQEAAAQCRARGGALARIDSPAQSAALYAQARAIDPDYRWWIGLTDQVQEGRFVWTDGTAGAPGQTSWADGQPDNASCNQDCASLRRGGGGVWVDVHCASLQPFVCRMP